MFNMRILNFKVTSDFVVNSLCTLTLGVGVADYTINVLLNDLYVKYFKEKYKYVFLFLNICINII